MKGRIRISAALLTAAFVLSMLSLGAARASAQAFVWNPPCVDTKIVNTTGCDANVTIAVTGGFVGPVFVPAGGTALIPLGGPVTWLKGVVTQAGTYVPVMSPGPIIPPPGPGTPSSGWNKGITFGPWGCCFDVYFEQPGGSGCYIWLIKSSAVPCIP